ncbi:hypothetical protein GQ53DRAFT_844271 [Thozetella sp. PMI_491]|nr:hypothetical protein GQ53DRAFT_844271 [Thozetella sp. PMI_491]
MFELPNAKRVRREELFESGSERDEGLEQDHQSDDTARAKLRAQLSNIFSTSLGYGEAAGDTAAGDSESGDKENRPSEEYEFRLFSRKGTSTQKVVLHQEDEHLANPGGLVKARPTSHYLRGELSAEARANIVQAALSGHDILREAQKRAWGLEKPWRVTRILAIRGAKPGGITLNTGNALDLDNKRKRPGKKRRIALRQKKKTKKEKEADEQQAKQAKEEHLKEKKKRLNREKKLKRRQKERDKRATAKADAGKEDEKSSDDTSLAGSSPRD